VLPSRTDKQARLASSYLSEARSAQGFVKL
jgi:hypothetical protein